MTVSFEITNDRGLPATNVNYSTGRNGKEAEINYLSFVQQQEQYGLEKLFSCQDFIDLGTNQNRTDRGRRSLTCER